MATPPIGPRKVSAGPAMDVSDTRTCAPGQNPAEGEEEMSAEQFWGRLFITLGLTRCLSAVEVRRCRTVCRVWRHLALDTVTPEALWHHDLAPAQRSAAWKEILLGGIKLQARKPQDCYESLCETPSSWDAAIRRDVNRTLPQEEFFKEKGGPGQSMLFRVLRALSTRLWDIGYCQSLNFIVATLIGVFPDDEAAVFHCTLALLLRHSLVDQYRPRFAKLGVTIWQFDKIVEAFLPKVHTELDKHGVNAEYYAIQWFLTVFASDLPQPTVRRIWDRFLVAGWQVIVQVGLALLYSVQDELPELDNSAALVFLRKFARSNTRGAEDLLELASTFRVSHRMLSSLEVAYGWEGEVQLFVAKDLNSGQVHWTVQQFPSSACTPRSPGPHESGDEDAPMPVPRAFNRGSSAPAEVGGIAPEASASPGQQPAGNVLPFLLHNLDTGETIVMERAWSKYQRESRAKAMAAAARAHVAPPPVREPPPPPPPPPRRHGQAHDGGTFWLQNVQSQASQRLRV